MEAEYLDSIVTEYYNGSAWVDITSYVVGDIKGNNGLGGWKPDQRVAVLGTLNITLNNKGKLFSPMGGDSVRGLSTLTGFNKGAKLRITGTFRYIPKVIWIGRIMSIDSDDKNWGNEQVRLMAVDWMYVPSNFPMKAATIGLNKRIDEAMTTILSRLSVQPEATSFATGSFTFPAVFDNVQRKTMALSEFTKLANSELGYIYVKHDGTLVAESMLTRHGWRALDQVTIPEKWHPWEDDHYLLMEDGNFLLLENGGKILLDEGTLEPAVTEDAAIHEDAEEYNILLSEDSLLNNSIIRCHPVITDTSLKVLYKLGTPLFIPSGQTVLYYAHYTDPNGLGQISGTNMQNPVATTDYLANSKADGTGTNYTANVVFAPNFYGDSVYIAIQNNATAGVYMTHLQVRGYGIYYGNSIESLVDDSASENAYGYAPFQFDQRYQKDTYTADMYGRAVIEEYKYPKSRITKMRYLANLNKNHMMSFLVLSIGSLILGTEDRSGISNHYYITDRAFTIKQGGIINVEYGVKQNDSYLSDGLEPVTIEFAGGTTGDEINYGYLHQVSSDANVARSFSVWVYLDTIPATGKAYSIYDLNAEEVSPCFYLAKKDATNANIRLVSVFTGNPGVWYSNSGFGASAWHHIVVTYDSSLTTNDPIFYIDGTPSTSGETVTPTGTKKSENGNKFKIGSWMTGDVDYSYTMDGKIFDARVYNRILSAAEVTTLYNAGVPDHTLVTDGLVFQGMATYTDRPITAGTVLSSTDRLVENIIRAVGVPNGSPTIRANP